MSTLYYKVINRRGEMAKKIIDQSEPARTHTFKGVTQKKLLIIAAIILVVGGMGTGIYLLQVQMRKSAEQSQSPKNTDNNEERLSSVAGDAAAEKKPEGAIEKSQAAIFKGDYSGAQQALDAELRNAGGDKQKAHDLLLQKASNAMNSKKFSEGLDFAKQAIAIQDDMPANILAANAAEAAGQKPVAKQYYQAAIDKYPKDSLSYQTETNRLKQDVERVSK